MAPHRGPDGEGFLLLDNVGFGHTRLSIIDLAGSPQPMTFAKLRTLVGLEIYYRAFFQTIRK